MNENIIILPARFQSPRYCNGSWLSQRSHWNADELLLLHAACDLGIKYELAATAIGRAPTALYGKAREQRIGVPILWTRDLSAYKPRAGLLNLQYPYIVKPTDENADLLAVNRMVSRAMPGREDVCQDIMLALLESKTSLAELRADPSALKAFVKSFRKKSYERSGGHGIESMDVTIHGTDQSKYESASYQRDLGDAVFWGRMKVAA